jgi:hypothetical protein
MSMVEFEANNVIAPMKNLASGMIAQANLAVSSGAQSYYIPSLFLGETKPDQGHYYTVAADMPANRYGVVYIAVSQYPADTAINPYATGIGRDICWPVPDGTKMDFRLPPRLQITTGVATQTGYWLHYRGSATGFLHIYRSSLGNGQDTKQFGKP